MTSHLLMIEDDARLAQMVGEYLGQSGMQVTHCADGGTGLAQLQSQAGPLPELVILDEPFSGLDPINAQALKDTVVDLKRQNRTVIFSTHIMDNAERLCDSVCIIAQGEKVLDGGVAEVREAHGGRMVALGLEGAPTSAVQLVLNNRALVARADDSNRYLEIELAAGARAPDLLTALVNAGASIERFELVRPSLHRIFLEKVGATHVEDGMSGQG